MSRLAPLRRDLDLLPSPLADRPGLLIRDPRQFAEGLVVIPPPLLPMLRYFDGGHTRGDLLAALSGAPQAEAEALVDHVEKTLAGGGFLQDDTYLRLRAERVRAFREAPVRRAVHAGGAYPRGRQELDDTLRRWMREGCEGAPLDEVVAIAAPHVSPEGGVRSYASAYGALPHDLAGRTFVVLGTSHYGEPNRFALTRKPYLTPYGPAPVDEALVDALEVAAPDAVLLEDYTHAVEHSVEFQVLFLQHLFGHDLRVVPILCGPFTSEGGYPEEDERVDAFIRALGELGRVRRDLVFVLGVDMAHVGPRYGDETAVKANDAHMTDVARRDRERIDRLTAGDAHGFWDLVGPAGRDDLNWCGASALYAFARALPGVSGELLHYEQWNIDDQSVVTFAGLAFRRSAPNA
jgi:AmmeMemoRadiSam system protein B